MNQDDFNEAERRSKLRMQVIYEGAKKPKREWVGLTDEDEIDWEEGGNLRDLVKAIEAKLKERNT
jgi:hypothetical protein